MQGINWFDRTERKIKSGHFDWLIKLSFCSGFKLCVVSCNIQNNSFMVALGLGGGGVCSWNNWKLMGLIGGCFFCSNVSRIHSSHRMDFMCDWWEAIKWPSQQARQCDSSSKSKWASLTCAYNVDVWKVRQIIRGWEITSCNVSINLVLMRRGDNVTNVSWFCFAI